jgi:hypothetical protein
VRRELLSVHRRRVLSQHLQELVLEDGLDRSVLLAPGPVRGPDIREVGSPRRDRSM